MKTDEIIAMAKEAGGYESPQYPENLVMDEHDLSRFAAMVAAKEREACAQVCESERVEYMELSAKNNGRESDYAFGSVNSAERIEAAIRARGQKEGA